ncbi:MAG: thioredoxin family protein [Candidatus Kerfeldbacteria bacterium]|nr:thioredoxin family protein [Candidatus Kerfeldbacteria bacterium]
MALTYSQPVKLHEPIPLFELPDADANMYTLGNWTDKMILVVIFTCNHCPYAQAVRPQLIELWNHYQQRRSSVQFVAINSNDASAYPEDATDKMKEERYAYPFPYLRDESQEAAREFGAVCTPDIFVYDRNRHLAYRGRINDDWQNPKNVARHDLREAIDALLRGERPTADQRPSMGCSLKWRRA